MTVQLTQTPPHREIRRLVLADGSEYASICDYKGTWKIIAYQEHGNGDYEPWVRCLDSDDRIIACAPARHFIIEFCDKDEAIKRRNGEMPF